MSIDQQTHTKPLTARQEANQAERDALIENVTWLLDTGDTHIDNIARRTNKTPATLERQLLRYRRPDLVLRMQGRAPRPKA
jgi:predicted Rossmann fold nucleotide-binding protein DprA/Smf involved in DNA uptake